MILVAVDYIDRHDSIQCSTNLPDTSGRGNRSSRLRGSSFEGEQS